MVGLPALVTRFWHRAPGERPTRLDRMAPQPGPDDPDKPGPNEFRTRTDGDGSEGAGVMGMPLHHISPVYRPGTTPTKFRRRFLVRKLASEPDRGKHGQPPL